MSFFSDLGNVLQQDLAKSVLPVLVADLQDVQANPQLYLNPVTNPVKIIKLQADVLNALPTLESGIISDVAGMLVTYVQKLQQPTARAVAAKPAIPVPTTAPAGVQHVQ